MAYKIERNKIKEQYKKIKEKIEELKSIELDKIEQSKKRFLTNKIGSIFTSGSKLNSINDTYIKQKDLFISNLNRIKYALNQKEIAQDTLFLFQHKLEKFEYIANTFISEAKLFNDYNNYIKISGKYVFNKSKAADLINAELTNIDNKMQTEKHNFCERKSNALFLPFELMLVIPLTKAVFSYVKNGFNKHLVDFENHKLYIDYFLPGCSVVQEKNVCFLSGGEKDGEPTPCFNYMRTDLRTMEEGCQMNYMRRFHTMIGLEKDANFYLCVLGGWDSKETEILDINYILSEDHFSSQVHSSNKNLLDYDKHWESLSPLNVSRSDCSAIFVNEKYVFVFGGWDYSTKQCVSKVERLQVFDGDALMAKNKWDVINVVGDASLLSKYNMGLIDIGFNIFDENNEILLVGGYDANYDYSNDVLSVVCGDDNSIKVKREQQLESGVECSFWYEKNFHKFYVNGDYIAVNFNCFNNVVAYSYKNKTFKHYMNSNINL